MKPELFTASLPAELLGEIEVANYPNQRPGPNRVRLAHVFLPDCRAGDFLLVTGGFQDTNDLSYPVETGLSLVLTPRATGTSGIVMRRERGRNVTQQVPGQGGMHHDTFEAVAQYRVGVHQAGDLYVAAIFVTGGGSTSAAGDVLKIDRVGDLQVSRWRV